MVSMTKSMAVEFATDQIRINAVCPGFLKTEMTEKLSDIGKMDFNKITRRIPMGRLGNTEELAKIVSFLCSEEASYITGHALVSDGGLIVNGLQLMGEEDV